MATGLSLEPYAAVQADLEVGQTFGDVLAAAGLSVEEWTEAQGEWLDRMGHEIENGRFELTNRYSQTFLERQRILTAPPHASVAPPPVAVPSAPEMAPAPVEGVPSYLVPTAPLPKVNRAPAALAGTSMAFVAPLGPALPFASGQPQVPGAPVAAPPVKRAPVTLAGTSMAFVAPVGPALPFAPDGAPLPTPAAPTPHPAPIALPGVPIKRAPAALAGTSMAFVAPLGPALPFAAGADPSPPSPPEPSAPTETAAPPVAPPPIKRATAELSGTSMSFVAPLGPALPFARGAPLAPPSPVVEEGRPATGDAVVPGATSNDPAPAVEAPKPDVASPPPAPAVPARPAPLTLQQYAALCAELAAFPDRTEATFQQFHLGNLRDRLTADLSWQERLRGNPVEYQAWQALYQRWVEHFEEQKRQGSGR